MTDANGNTATGTITVNIVDDVPTATLDSGNVNEGALLTVAASGVLIERRCRGGRLCGRRRGCGGSRGGRRPDDGCDDGRQHQHCGAARHARSAGERRLHLPVDGEQHHGEHHRRVCLHGQGRRRRPVDDDADDQPCQRHDRCAGGQRRHGERDRAGHDDYRVRPGGRDDYRQPRHQQSVGDGCDQPAQRFGRVRHADLCAGERRQRGDGGHLRHHPGQRRTAPTPTR